MKMDDIDILTQKAKTELVKKVDYYSRFMDTSFGKITIRHQKTRWGSCSSKRNLSFNCLLMLAPEYVQDYVIVHELAHIKEMNHSENFWNIVKRILPEYQEAKKWLNTEGKILVRRILIDECRTKEL